MLRPILSLAAVAALIMAASGNHASAFSAAGAHDPALTGGEAALVEKTAMVCNAYGCRYTSKPWRYPQWGWGWPPGYVYRPACPAGYHYTCRIGPLGYGDCACWPYR